MYVVQTHKATTGTPVVATNDANVTTGNQSARWAGITLTDAGAVGNVAAGAGLTYVNTPTDVTARNVLQLLYMVTLTGTLTAGADNYIITEPSFFKLADTKTIIGAKLIGIRNLTTEATYNSLIIGTVANNAVADGAEAVRVEVIKGRVKILVKDGFQAKVQGRELLIMVDYI